MQQIKIMKIKSSKVGREKVSRSLIALARQVSLFVVLMIWWRVSKKQS